MGWVKEITNIISLFAKEKPYLAASSILFLIPWIIFAIRPELAESLGLTACCLAFGGFFICVCAQLFLDYSNMIFQKKYLEKDQKQIISKMWTGV